VGPPDEQQFGAMATSASGAEHGDGHRAVLIRSVPVHHGPGNTYEYKLTGQCARSDSKTDIVSVVKPPPNMPKW
jgi:hypothetical protein